MRTLDPSDLLRSVSLGIALLSAACGGTSDSERPQRTNDGEGPVLDLYDCQDVVEAYEFRILEPFDDANVSDDGSRTLGWWVSYDGSNDVDVVIGSDADGNPIFGVDEFNFSPSPPADTVITAALVGTSEGGAPSLAAGANQCDASRRAMRVHSGEPGFTGWGYALGSNFNWNGSGEDPGDAREWEGLAFWGRLAQDSPLATVSATVIDEYTTSSDFDYCKDGLYVDESCDTFGRGVGLDTEWRLVTVPFDEMYQEGFGLPAPSPMPEIEQLLGVTYYFGKGSWEIWLDEVAYYRSKDD